MPKPTRNNCKNGKQTSLLVYTRCHKFQTIVDTTKPSRNNKKCITHQSDMGYLCLIEYVSDKITRLLKKYFHIWQKLKQRNKGGHPFFEKRSLAKII